jgi:uncharacterized protein YqeY
MTNDIQIITPSKTKAKLAGKADMEQVSAAIKAALV